MQKKGRELRDFFLKSKVYFLILNITLSIVAFSFIVAMNGEVVSGQENPFDPLPPNLGKLSPSDLRVGSGGATPPAGVASHIPGPSSQVQPNSAGFLEDINTFVLKDAIFGSFAWGIIVGGVVYLGATLFGVDSNTAKTLGLSAFSGVTAFNLAHRFLVGKTLFGKPALFFGDPIYGAQGALGTEAPLPGGFVGGGALALGIGVAIAIVVYIALYEKESKKIVTFTCEPWEAPVGGGDCEKCNNDPFRPCSEYRCRSLGQACQLLNKGTGNETCAWVNPKDVVSPGIAPWNEVLSSGHQYRDVRIRPPGSGVEPGRARISGPAEEGCIKAFTPLQFGVTTTEPAQCKIDYNHTVKFDNMAFFMGETNLFLYNHSQRLSLPGPMAFERAAPELKNDGEYTLYIRCKDANGNENIDEFAVRFCVEKGPDTTPAKIEATSVRNRAPVGFDTRSVQMQVYLNEPAECKWSREDRDYNNMENSMQCSTEIFEMNANLLYPCNVNLTGIRDRQTNDFYFRCKDQPGAPENERNVNTESFKFTLQGTEPLKILSVAPNGTVQGAGDFVSVFLEVETAFGEHEGDATCFYSRTGRNDEFIRMFETGTNKHRQRQDLSLRNYTYFFRCIDLGGNADSNSTRFGVFVDRISPRVTRAYQDAQLLKVLTDELTSCSYSNKDCRFSIENGNAMPQSNSTEHFAEWKTDHNYYIKCADTSGNEPLPDQCSIIVRVYGKAG